MARPVPGAVNAVSVEQKVMLEKTDEFGRDHAPIEQPETFIYANSIVV
jgi:hypothetical protein